MKHILRLLLLGFLLPPSLSLLVDGGDHQTATNTARDSNNVHLPDDGVKARAETYPGSSSSIATQLEMPPVEQMDLEISASESSKSLASDTPESVKEPDGFEPGEGLAIVQGGNDNTKNSDGGNVDSMEGVHSVDPSSVPTEQMNVPKAQENQPSSPSENAGVEVPPPSQPGDPNLSQQQQQQQQHQQEQIPETVGQPSAVPSNPATDFSKPSLENPRVAGGQAQIPTSVDGDKPGGVSHPGQGTLESETARRDNPPSVQPSQSDAPALNVEQSVEKKIVSSSLPVGTGGMAVNSLSPSSDGATVAAEDGVGVNNNGVDGTVDAVTTPSQIPEGTGEEEFPTFDKWSVQYLAEQEKQKIELEMEQVTKPGLAVGKKKLRLNFAASSCGAKIVANNPEADNIIYVLNGNPDEYLISPCKAKKWFVVELCEPLQIHKVEIGTMELFSSLPKSFRVLSSLRYPAKEWTPLGSFEMKAERTVQSFPTPVLEEYVKFVRVELLEHHGNEHYCPITFFRVLGLDMASEEEEEPDHEALDSQDQEQDDRSVSLFEKTKDTVVKLVQKVLYNGDGEESEKKEPSAEKQADNSTVESSETKEETKATPSPCSGNASPTQAKEASPPSVHMPEVGCIPDPVTPKPEGIPIVTKLADTEQLPPEDREPPLVVKLDTPKAGMEDGRQRCMTPWLSQAKLVYSGLMLHMSLAPSCRGPMAKVVEEDTATEDRVPISSSTVSDEITPTATLDVLASQTDDSITSQMDTDTKAVHTASPANAGTDVSSVRPEVSSSTPEKQPSQEGEAVVSKNSPDGAVESENLQESLIASSQSTVFTSDGVSTPTTQTLEPSSLTRQVDRKDSAASVVTPGLHVTKSRVVNEQGSSDLTESIFLKVSPSPTTSVQDMQENTLPPETATTKLPQDIAPPKDISSGALGHQSGDPSNSGHLEETVLLSAQQKSENVTHKPPVDHRSVDLVKVPVTFNSKRDASFIKLNNRIVALELNVSMTKKYLEELSRAFKQQNEDMMSLVNKTVYRLNLNIAASEERDLHQQTQLDLLAQRLVNLTVVVSQMQVLMDDMHEELHQRQLIMGMLQAVLFVWLMISTLRGRCKPQHSIADHQFLLDTMPKQPQVTEALDVGPGQRRNSDVGIKSEVLTDMPLKRQSSDTNIALSSTLAGNAENTASVLISSQGSKKKKRKKMKLSLPITTTTSAQANTDIKSVAAAESFKMVNLPVTSTSSVSPVSLMSNIFLKPGVTLRPLDEVTANISPVSHDELSVFPSKQAVKENIPILSRASPPLSRDSQHPSPLPWSPLYSVRENGLCKAQPPPSCEACRPSPPSPLWSKSLTPPLGSLENVQLAQHPPFASRAFTHSSSPRRRMTLEVKDSQSSSPEFKLPSYHRAKLRKLGQALEASTSGFLNKKRGGGVAKHGFGPSSFSSKKPPSNIPARQQLPFSDFFNEEILLSENRFHLPENETMADQVSPPSFINRGAAVGLGLEPKPRTAAVNQSQVLAVSSYPLNPSLSSSLPTSPSSPHSHPTIRLPSPSVIPIGGTPQPIVRFPSVAVPKPLHIYRPSTPSIPFPASILSLPAPPPSRTDKEQQQVALSQACPLTQPPFKPKDQGGHPKPGGGKNGNKRTSPKSHRRQGSFPSEIKSGTPPVDGEPKGSSNKLPSKLPAAHTHSKMKKSGSLPAVQEAKVQGQGQAVRIPKDVALKGAKC